MREVLFIKPVFKQMIWGGSRMRTAFGYDIPGDDTGECWAISAHPNGDCTIAEGTFKGSSLSSLWKDHRELFGGMRGEVFPLLTKIIDAKNDLSIQVHPDDEYAGAHENGSLGKTECWYILDCEPGTSIVIGHYAKDHAELEDMIRNGRWSEFIREIPVHKGDFFQIYPGTVHAIKGGTLILETQQNSDITYRVYDYGRLQNGKPRALHVEQSIDVIRAPFEDTSKAVAGEKLIGGANESLISCDYYSVWKLDVSGSETYKQNQGFLLCSVTEGSGLIDGRELKKGDHFILPCGYGDFTLTGDMQLIVSTAHERQK